MNIVLAGMPGSGKTTVALCLHKITGAPVVDTDEEIVREHGEINKIFAEFGEEYFRDLESAVCERLCALDNAIISTGGGCFLRKKNAEILKKKGKIIYLGTTPETIIKRLEGDTTRPLLAGDGKARIYALFEARKSVYERVADYTIYTDGLSPEEIAQKIKELSL